MGAVQAEQRRIAQDILRDLGVPLWIICSYEGSDQTFERLVGHSVVPTFLFLSPNQERVIVAGLDADNIDMPDKVVYRGRTEIEPTFVQTLRDFGFPGTAAINYSTMFDVGVDRLRAGQRDWLDRVVAETFPDVFRADATQRVATDMSISYRGQRNPREVLFSAEGILYALYDRKTPDQLAKMRVAARRAQEILETAFSTVRPGMTDFEARDLVQRITTETKPDYFAETGVVSETFAWEKDMCPIVLTGETFAKGGHAMSCGAVIEPGNTLYFDFGVKLTFQDGTHWSSDLQRVGYVLREGEITAPPEVHHLFGVLYASVQAGIAALRPGAKGWEVDAIARKVITDAGYQSYNHSTGHAIGEEAHNPGTLIGVRQTPGKTESLTVQPNGVYTIEPRIQIPNGVSIEEDIWVNPNGPNEPLCKPQTALYLIGAR